MTSQFMLAHRGDLSILDRTDMAGEWKLDGSRIHIKLSPTSLEMWSRNSKDNTYRVNYGEVHNLPEVEADIHKLKCKSIWLDCEVCWFNRNGRSVMRGSQVRCGTRNPHAVREKMKIYPINAMAFDLLELNGEEYIKQPYIVRKAILKDFLNQHTNLTSLRYLPYTLEKHELWQRMLNLGEEGIMAKTLMGKYEFRRSHAWLKLKNEKVATRTVVGYTEGKNARSPYFGSLVLMDDEGNYSGNVGGGFNRQELEWFKEQLLTAPSVPKTFPFKQVGEKYTAVKLPFKVKVRYYEKLPSGALRFPVYVSVVKP